jgi:hypothetical protein
MKQTFERIYKDGYNDSPYGNPEMYGMERVAELEWDNQSYQFDITSVLRRKEDGTLWFCNDSGCSCPSPFEDDYEWERLFSTEDFQKRYRERTTGDYSWGHTDQQQYEQFIADIERALQELRERS